MNIHIDLETEKQARYVLDHNKVAIFVVAYNAEKQIENVLKRIPDWISKKVVEIFVVDDCSHDNTLEITKKIQWSNDAAPLCVYKTPYNQGYGGNQRLGYLYAIAKNYDYVVLLHADGRYAPEVFPCLIAPHAQGADIVYGSRFLTSSKMAKGKMPFYKWVGNRFLTFVQNMLVGTRMSEFHCAFCSLRVEALKKVPFQLNSLGFDFNTDIIIQFFAAGFKMIEVSVPPYYGEEIRSINGIGYAWGCLKSSLKYFLMKFEIFYDPKFDLRDKYKNAYTSKKAKTSLHDYMRRELIQPGTRLLDVGGGNGKAVGEHHANQGVKVVNIDLKIDSPNSALTNLKVDLDQPWQDQIPYQEYNKKFDTAFALDILEHLKSPEKCAQEIFNILKSGGKLYASTGNISYFPLRFMHALGQFNYGRRGILDLTHMRLFTINGFRRLLINYGFKVEKVVGFGPPVEDLRENPSFLLRILDRLLYFLAKVYPKLFAFQILLICIRTDSPQDLMLQTFLKEHHTVDDAPKT